MDNYYKILELSENATAAEIKKAFRKLAVKHHPDKNNGSKEAEKKMKKVNEAYAVLSNAQLKKEYDQLRAQPAQPAGRPYGSSKYENQRRSQQYGGYQFEGFDEFVKRSFEYFSDSWSDAFGFATRKGDDLQGDLNITSAEANSGCVKNFTFEKTDLCPNCFGNSSKHSDWLHCHVCNGAGQVIIRRSLNIKIPRHTPSGHMLRLRGEGKQVEDGEPGDLYVKIFVQQNKYEVDPLDHYQDEYIGIEKAYHGGPYFVQTPNGNIRITLPKLIWQDRMIRIKNEGKFRSDYRTKGHLYLRFHIRYNNQTVTDKQSQMLEEIQLEKWAQTNKQ